MLGLEDLSNQLNTQVSSSTADSLPSNIYNVIAGWLSKTAWPMIIGIAVAVTLLFTFYGAFLYFTAYGDENRATQAKKTITYAIIGFVISLFAMSIAAYIENSLMSKDSAANLTAPIDSGSGTSGAAVPTK